MRDKNNVSNLKEMPENLQTILRKMFDVVQVNPDTFKFTDDWYHKHTWNKEQEQEFKEWFLDFVKLKKNNIGVVQFPRKLGKKDSEEFFGYFNFMYGWTREDYEIEEEKKK